MALPTVLSERLSVTCSWCPFSFPCTKMSCKSKRISSKEANRFRLMLASTDREEGTVDDRAERHNGGANDHIFTAAAAVDHLHGEAIAEGPNAQGVPLKRAWNWWLNLAPSWKRHMCTRAHTRCSQLRMTIIRQTVRQGALRIEAEPLTIHGRLIRAHSCAEYRVELVLTRLR